MRRYGSKQVTVLGMVSRPGAVPLESDQVSLMELVNRAGGIRSGAGPSIEIWRGTGSSAPGRVGFGRREVVPVEMLYGRAGMQINPSIHPGDVVRIASGSEGYVYLSGEVASPGARSYRRPFTILQAVATAGGLTKVAAGKKCRLVRRTADGGEQMMAVDLKAIEEGREANVYLAQNDTIIVPVDPVKKFFDDVDQLIRRGVNVGVDTTYDAAEGMGWNVPAD